VLLPELFEHFFGRNARAWIVEGLPYQATEMLILRLARKPWM
jgi:hypothetical protein